MIKISFKEGCQVEDLVEIGLTYSALSAMNKHLFLIGIESQLS